MPFIMLWKRRHDDKVYHVMMSWLFSPQRVFPKRYNKDFAVLCLKTHQLKGRSVCVQFYERFSQIWGLKDLGPSMEMKLNIHLDIWMKEKEEQTVF